MIIETCPECGHDLVNFEIATYPPIPQKECWNCGWRWTGEPEKIVRIPFNGNNLKIGECSKNNNKEIKPMYTDTEIKKEDIYNLFS